MRLVIARCSVDYAGRLDAHLPEATRLIMVKADGCVAIHADGGAYKPLNWMNAPNRLVEITDTDPVQWIVTNPKNEKLPDLQPREWASVLPLCALAILMGVVPSIFLAPMEPAVRKVVERVQTGRAAVTAGAPLPLGPAAVPAAAGVDATRVAAPAAVTPVAAVQGQ